MRYKFLKLTSLTRLLFKVTKAKSNCGDQLRYLEETLANRDTWRLLRGAPCKALSGDPQTYSTLIKEDESEP